MEVTGWWREVSVLEIQGLLGSARDVDPQGAADFVRWILRYGLSGEGWKALARDRGVSSQGLDEEEDHLVPFTSAEEFRNWADRVRSAARGDR